jgi:hypothetical protein
MTTIYRDEITDPDFTVPGSQFVLPKLCKHCRLRHIGGTADIEISFNSLNGALTPVGVVLSPVGGSPYPQETTRDWDDGFSQINANTTDGILEIVAWR